MSRKSVGYQGGYEHRDFSNLLKELNKNTGSVDIDGTCAVVVEPEESYVSVSAETEKRHRIMSNERIKFLYSSKIGVIHDKHCICAKQIPDDDLEYCEEYQVNLKHCPECMIQAYVVSGAKDPKEIDSYLKFFKKVGITEEHAKNIFIDNKMYTRISPDILTIWHKEDTWKIKALPKKGRVQVFHNNYKVKAKGERAFTQGFHVQSMACEDTDIDYALNVIKNYKYKPEECALHISGNKDAAQRKLKIEKSQAQEKAAVSIETLLGDAPETLTIWQKLKRAIRRLIKKNNFFELNDFWLVSEHGYPKNQTICIYIWEDKNGQLAWQTGIYNQKLEQFSVRYGQTVYAINQNKVIAWKKMSAEAVAIEIQLHDGK